MPPFLKSYCFVFRRHLIRLFSFFYGEEQGIWCHHYAGVSACLRLLSFELLKHFADYHETWYESDAVRGHLSSVILITV
jgi:hypothetical protein